MAEEQGCLWWPLVAGVGKMSFLHGHQAGNGTRHLDPALASQLSQWSLPRGTGAWPNRSGTRVLARDVQRPGGPHLPVTPVWSGGRRFSHNLVTARRQLTLASTPGSCHLGSPFEFLLVLTENPREGQGRLHTPGLRTPAVTRGGPGCPWSRDPALARTAAARGSPGPRHPLRLQSSVVWPGVLGDQRLCAVLWWPAGSRGQALHGLSLVLLGLVVEQDANCHQDGADGRQAGDFVAKNYNTEPNGQGVLHGAGNAARQGRSRDGLDGRAEGWGRRGAPAGCSRPPSSHSFFGWECSVLGKVSSRDAGTLQ